MSIAYKSSSNNTIRTATNETTEINRPMKSP